LIKIWGSYFEYKNKKGALREDINISGVFKSLNIGLFLRLMFWSESIKKLGMLAKLLNLYYHLFDPRLRVERGEI